jgi:hypothetical protein
MYMVACVRTLFVHKGAQKEISTQSQSNFEYRYIKAMIHLHRVRRQACLHTQQGRNPAGALDDCTCDTYN